jgi:toxin ParE1/3/4
MSEVIWTPQAEMDLEEIADYIAVENSQAALKLIEEIEKKVNRLKDHPESGRKVPELSGALHLYREVIVRNYRVIYRYSGEKVYILTVRHGRRELEGILLQ